MPHELINERNIQEGLDVVICYVNDISTGIFIPLLLMGIWIVLAMGGYFIQKNTVGTGDFPMTSAVAGYVVVIIAFILSLVDCGATGHLVSGASIAIAIAVAVISTLWFLFSRDQ